MKFSVITFGCAFNKHDSEIIISNLKREFEYTNNPLEADVIVINTCAVKNLAETKAFRTIRFYEKYNKKLVIAGCIPQSEPSYLNNKLKNYSVIGTNDLDKINEVVKATLNNNTLKIISNLNKKCIEFERLKENTFRFNKVIEIIPISEGCLGNCSYCKTKLARGNLKSYNPLNIVSKIESSLNDDVKEFWLTSQDIGCYGLEIKTNIIELLKKILAIKKKFKIRLGMGNPFYFKSYINGILNLMKEDDRIYKFLHIPLQSGNDRILKEMQRKNSVKDFLEIIKVSRETIPNITIATDIIVAYPTETYEEFLDNLKVIQEIKPNILNISRFWLRKGTFAEKKYDKKDFIDGKESKRRSKILLKCFNDICEMNNKKWLNWIGMALINEKGKDDSLICRNDFYLPIILTKEEIIRYYKNHNKKLKIGDIVKVRIVKTRNIDYIGVIID